MTTSLDLSKLSLMDALDLAILIEEEARRGMSTVQAFEIGLAAADFFENPELAVKARSELMEQRGDGFVYTPLLGDRSPALDYRVKQ